MKHVTGYKPIQIVFDRKPHKSDQRICTPANRPARTPQVAEFHSRNLVASVFVNSVITEITVNTVRRQEIYGALSRNHFQTTVVI